MPGHDGGWQKNSAMPGACYYKTGAKVCIGGYPPGRPKPPDPENVRPAWAGGGKAQAYGDRPGETWHVAAGEMA